MSILLLAVIRAGRLKRRSHYCKSTSPDPWLDANCDLQVGESLVLGKVEFYLLLRIFFLSKKSAFPGLPKNDAVNSKIGSSRRAPLHKRLHFTSAWAKLFFSSPAFQNVTWRHETPSPHPKIGEKFPERHTLLSRCDYHFSRGKGKKYKNPQLDAPIVRGKVKRSLHRHRSREQSGSPATFPEVIVVDIHMPHIRRLRRTSGREQILPLPPKFCEACVRTRST